MVATMAHCVFRFNASGLTIKVGSINPNNGGVVVKKIIIITHSLFRDEISHDNDVEVLHLEGALCLTNQNIEFIRILLINSILNDQLQVFKWSKKSQ